MVKLSREFQVFVKPVGALCNLQCRYCYYLNKAELYKQEGLIKMPDSILEKYIIQLIQASTDKNIFFSWHGGEPTLAGLAFFRKVVNLQQKHLPEGHIIINGIQTNATLLNDDWCRFFADAGFLAGVSIDGPEYLHNKFRVSEEGRDSFKKTINGYNLLAKFNVQTEILCVVNEENVNFPHEVYRFLRQLGSNFMTFLPLVERDPVSESRVSTISVPAESFGIFLSTVFDEWVEEDIGRIKIQIIEESARTAFNQEHTLCIFKKTCGGVPVVEHNGDFYSCDHYVDKDHLIGNITITSLSDLLDSDAQQAFGLVKLANLPAFCRECEVLEMCNGECPKNRFILTPTGEPGLNYLCPGYKIFFNHIKPFVDTIAQEWNQQKNS